MPYFKANMHQIQFRPRPCWGSLQCSPDTVAKFKGPTSKGRKGEGKGREKGEPQVFSQVGAYGHNVNVLLSTINLFDFDRQPCRYCFYSMVQKCVFRPAGATRCPDKRELWHGGACPISRLSGRKCGNTAPKTVKISNFGQKFVPQGRLVCNFLTKFSVFVRVYR